MDLRYDDILNRIREAPRWWLNGVPRYDAFRPEDATVHSRRVLLVHTRCVCGTDYFQGMEAGEPEFEKMLAQGRVGLGDPPNACHIVGRGECTNFSTSCRELRVVECWERVGAREQRIAGRDWKRVPQHEIELHDWHAG
jgi:hypothetical protein